MPPLSAATSTMPRGVLDCFGPAADSLHGIRTGLVNKHWRVEAGGRTYALRRYNPIRSDAAIAWEHALLDHVAGQGWPVASALPSADGATLINHGGARFSLFPFLPGRPAPYGNLRHLRIKGGILARLHATTAVWRAPGQRPGHARMAKPEAALRNAGYASFEELLEPFRRHDASAAACLLAEWHAVLDQLGSLDVEDLPDIPAHMDFHNANIFFRRGRFTGLLDFDSVQLDQRVADVATALSLDCRVPPAYNALDPTAVEAFLAGYGEHATLSDAELRAVLPLLRMQALGHAGSRLRQWAQEGSPRALRSLYRTVGGRIPAFAERQTVLAAAVQRGGLASR